MYESRVFFFSIAMLSASLAYAGDGTILRRTDPVSGVYIAWMTPTARSIADANAEDIARTTGSVIRHKLPLFNGFSFRGNESIAMAVSKDSRVRIVTEVGSAHITGSGTQTAPSWGLDRINQQFLPLDHTYGWTNSGVNVVVYVIDTGVNVLPDLGSRVERRESFVSGETQVLNDCGAGTGIPNGHGTSVAEIVAGTTYGVAKDAQIVSLRAFNCNGTAIVDDIEAAIHRMIDLHVAAGAEMAVANFSWIIFSVDPALDGLVLNAISSGILVATAAGDANGNACNYSPARLGDPSQYSPNPSGLSTLTVAGSSMLPSPTDPSAYDAIRQYTDTGHCVSIFAPATAVMTLNSAGAPISFDGTSAAVPHVAGVAALHFELTQLANNPAAIQGLIKQNGGVNLLVGVPSDTPNLLLSTGVSRQRGCCS